MAKTEQHKIAPRNQPMPSLSTPTKWLGGITAGLIALTALLSAWEDLRDKVCDVGIPAPWCEYDPFGDDDPFGDRNPFR